MLHTTNNYCNNFFYCFILVCELLVDMDTGTDVNRIRYWVKRADKQFPHHPIIFKLKEKMLMAERPNDSSEDLEALIACKC